MRRFPTPWKSVELTESVCIRDANGLTLAYLYFRDHEGTAKAAGVLSRDEARRSLADQPC